MTKQNSTAAEPSFAPRRQMPSLVRDHRVRPDAPELAQMLVERRQVAAVDRSANAIQTIARIVHNSLCEPDIRGTESIDLRARLGLLEAMEIIGTYLSEVTCEMRETDDGITEFERTGGGHE